MQRIRAGRHPVLLLALGLVLLGAVPALLWEVLPTEKEPPGRREVDRRYASQIGEGDRAREIDVDNRSDEHIDGAVETCGGLGTGNLAERFGLPEDPERVARRFASRFEPAFRPAVYRGCLQGLLEGG